ncbi:hypothetical protein LCGC14_1646460 [marine sediment metagenome]|uniref:Uncharacterized protein n=1 Tax=marine sediment metagenome TaxID=412755 RepID=A0A0F9HY30_9ZZZZ
MTEFKESEGNLESFQIAQKDGKPIEGKKKDGTPWKMYKLRIDENTFSTFKKLEEFEVSMGDYVLVTYTEKPNPQNASSPYKNIVNIVKGLSKEEVKESDEQYNVEPTGKKVMGQTKEEPKTDWDEINERKQKNIQVTSCFHRTLDFIFSKKELTVDNHFDNLFDKLWNKIENKRKEKLK